MVAQSCRPHIGSSRLTGIDVLTELHVFLHWPFCHFILFTGMISLLSFELNCTQLGDDSLQSPSLISGPFAACCVHVRPSHQKPHAVLLPFEKALYSMHYLYLSNGISAPESPTYLYLPFPSLCIVSCIISSTFATSRQCQ